MPLPFSHYLSIISRQKWWNKKKVYNFIIIGPDGKKPYNGFIDAFAKSIKNEGVKGLWVGLGTYYARIAPHAMITVLLQDFFHDLLTAYQKKNVAWLTV